MFVMWSCQEIIVRCVAEIGSIAYEDVHSVSWSVNTSRASDAS